MTEEKEKKEIDKAAEENPKEKEQKEAAKEKAAKEPSKEEVKEVKKEVPQKEKEEGSKEKKEAPKEETKEKAAVPPEGKGKKRKKINRMTLEEVEKHLQNLETKGGLTSLYGQHLLERQKEIKGQKETPLD